MWRNKKSPSSSDLRNNHQATDDESTTNSLRKSQSERADQKRGSFQNSGGSVRSLFQKLRPGSGRRNSQMEEPDEPKTRGQKNGADSNYSKRSNLNPVPENDYHRHTAGQTHHPQQQQQQQPPQESTRPYSSAAAAAPNAKARRGSGGGIGIGDVGKRVRIDRSVLNTSSTAPSPNASSRTSSTPSTYHRQQHQSQQPHSNNTRNNNIEKAQSAPVFDDGIRVRAADESPSVDTRKKPSVTFRDNNDMRATDRTATTHSSPGGNESNRPRFSFRGRQNHDTTPAPSSPRRDSGGIGIGDVGKRIRLDRAPSVRPPGVSNHDGTKSSTTPATGAGENGGRYNKTVRDNTTPVAKSAAKSHVGEDGIRVYTAYDGDGIRVRSS